MYTKVNIIGGILGACGILIAWVLVPYLHSIDGTGYDPFNANIKEIVSMVLLPDESNFSLIKKPIILSGSEMTAVCEALRKAQPIQPNHPSVVWECRLKMETRTNAVTVDVSNSGSDPNGVLVYWWSPIFRLNNGARRCDELGAILEAVVKSKKLGDTAGDR